MPANYLHIWPRGRFMLIAAPNLDGSFTTTLFLPLSFFEQFAGDGSNLLNFFQQYFPDAVDLMGHEQLLHAFDKVHPQPIFTIKCSPHHSSTHNLVILGDAAHALLPFYGQGCNSSFEDCLILIEQLIANQFDFSRSFAAYSKARVGDCLLIAELSEENYRVMTTRVREKSFLIRQWIDNVLHRLMPRTWVPMYSMITFSRLSYSTCTKYKKWQDKVLKRTVEIASLCVLFLIGYSTFRNRRVIFKF